MTMKLASSTTAAASEKTTLVSVQCHAAGAGNRPGQVEAASPPGRLAEHERCDERGQDSDGHVHEQHPPPGHIGGEQAAGDKPDRRAAAAHRGVHAHRPVTCRAFLKCRHDERERGGCDHGAADALDRPCGEEPLLRCGEASGK
jgi:hypothetical protein